MLSLVHFSPNIFFMIIVRTRTSWDYHPNEIIPELLSTLSLRYHFRRYVCINCRIPAMLVLVILVAYTSLGGVLMSNLEPWTFFTAFYWSFITMTTVNSFFHIFHCYHFHRYLSHFVDNSNIMKYQSRDMRKSFFQVGFGDLMPRRDGYMYLILLYIILGSFQTDANANTIWCY